MKANELKKKNNDELNKELLSLLRTHFNLRIRHATQQLENVSQLRLVRRDIARVRTVLNERIRTL
ncbi:MAG TPA: 50S ribosomal protein L29 [Nitrosomonas nitrosa]|jgi:large subunit ribosomal protein L29|uniref:Large ribosomal subunit protein uL29 n=1 Tax=Nitrosomonas nitrosa TaxID=52442 RepID=A0A1I4QQL2_9PROT|nr:50S ribosomal protein L29 [Nitrosomonas nitrosa]MCO6434483.1 50S ribosomal protein L29 [Nitrosomonas nitrosa]PTR03606.1 LSU ribosomal protein L29P [Nitrosomonas nitrosa]CAE6501431.1 50S ribosomal subunit protein L29 [Nitrosomonas nitrosa]SFM42398.1 LSU ribosomal protein L29P [Nitrosomonas nitrosa]HBZ31042.1 50S ribosomal protein L29 [Nitrosomonas nitrosa]